MKTVFCKDKKEFCDCIERCTMCKYAKGNGIIEGFVANDVLTTLFGEGYSIKRIMQLVDADRQGRCLILTEEQKNLPKK